MNTNPIARAVQILGGPAKVAVLLGVTTQAVCFWRDELRKFPIEFCSVIESATDGEITRQDMRPKDYWLIWPDLKAPETEGGLR